MDQRSHRIERTHRLRDLASEWAARHHAPELEANMRCWIGAADPDEVLIGQAIAFALVVMPERGSSLINRFRATRRHWSRLDRLLFEAWDACWFTVCEVHDVRVGTGLVLDDVVTGLRHEVREESMSWVVDPGDWLVAVLQPFEGGLELEGTARRLARSACLPVVQALLPQEGTDWPTGSRRRMRPTIEALHEAAKPPRLVNHDRHDIVLLTCEVGLDWPGLVSSVGLWDDVAIDEDSVVWLGPVVPSLAGPLVLATFHKEEDRTELELNSRERLEALQQVWQARTGQELVVTEERVHRPPSDPEGRELMMDSSYQTVEEGRDPADLTHGLAGHWLDLSVPALDGLSPRAAVAAGRRAEVWAILPDALGLEAARFLRAALGFPLLAETDFLYNADVAPDPERWRALSADDQLAEIIEHHELDEPHTMPMSLRAHGLLHAMVEHDLAESWPPAVEALGRFLAADIGRHEAIHAQCALRIRMAVEGEARGREWTDEELAQALHDLTLEDWLSGSFGELEAHPG